ncbi:MAG: 3-phosphoshikimate 1-carboxyvinyltransferase [Actinomycetales bacterium]|nr:3-phosphoshikimate 1-carboxyvinyltransferase [Actinomycetales bacterium]
MRATVDRAARLRGVVRVPGDKSASHRALLLSALAEGTSHIDGLSPGEDVQGTGVIIERLGAARQLDGERTVVTGGALRAADGPLDCGNSGTTMRLVAGLVSGIDGEHVLVGDPSLSKRPMDRVAVPLRAMGALVSGAGERLCAPLRITGSSTLRGIDYEVPVPSAQVKSAILLAGLTALGPTIVHERVRTRTTTEDMLVLAGLSLESIDVGAGRRVELAPGRPLARDWRVPGDPSQAAFFAVLGAVHADAELAVASIDVAPERSGFVGVLRRMGATVSFVDADGGTGLAARSSSLTGTTVRAEEIPSVDEVPALTVAAAAATGVTAFVAMGELRVKESDRFAGSMALASSLGCRVWSEGDDFFVEGLGSAKKFHHFEQRAVLDHRMVMAAAIAGAAGAGCVIDGAETVATSYPTFFTHLDGLR